MLFRSLSFRIWLIFFGLFFFFVPSFVLAQNEPIPVEIRQLNITATADQKGKLQIQENFDLQNQFSPSEFYWLINAEKIQNLKIFRNNQEIPKKDYQLKKWQDQLVILGLYSQNPLDNWQLSYQMRGDFKATKDGLEFRFQPIKNPGAFILKANIQIQFPKELNPTKTSQKLYAVHGVEDANFYYNSNKLIYLGQNLSPYSSFTCQANLEDGTVQIPVFSKLLAKISIAGIDFWFLTAFFFPIITIFILFLMIFIIRKRENIQEPAQTITAPPAQMSPLLVGVLFRQQITGREIAAELLSLASRGFLVISEKTPGYNLAEKKSLEGLKPYERLLIDELLKGHFKESLTDFTEQPQKELFSEAVANLYQKVYDEIALQGYFVTNPRIVIFRYKIMGMILFFLSVLAFFLAGQLIDPPYLVFSFFGTAIASLFIINLAGSLPRRTPKGHKALQNWLAFRKYLIEYPEKPDISDIWQEKFIQNLPYAVVFGCEQEWADHFSHVPFKMPDWYLTYTDISTLPEFTKRTYPLIDVISRTILALKEPIL